MIIRAAIPTISNVAPPSNTMPTSMSATEGLKPSNNISKAGKWGKKGSQSITITSSSILSSLLLNISSPSSSSLLLLLGLAISSIEDVPFASVFARLANGPTSKISSSGADRLRDGSGGGVDGCFSKRGGDGSGDGSMYAGPSEG